MVKNNTVKISLILFVVLTFSLLGFSKKTTVESKWTISPVKIDGNHADWGGEALSSEKKFDVDYAFRNDADYLYALFIFKNRKFLSSITTTGMTLWFNTEGKKKKNYGIKLIKKRIPADIFIALLEQERGVIPEEKKKEFKKRRFYFVHDFEVIDKKSKTPFKSPPGQKIEKPTLRSVNTRALNVYEFQIPLKGLKDQIPGIGTEPGKNIKVGFEWGGMTKELRKQMMQKRATGKVSDTDPSLRGEKWSTERDRVSGGDTRSPEKQSIRGRYKKHSFWVDVKLAQK